MNETYQTQVKKYLLDGLYVFAAAAYDLSLQHALEDFGDETLALHFVLNVRVVAKARLYQILQQEQQELLRIGLSTYFELV